MGKRRLCGEMEKCMGEDGKVTVDGKVDVIEEGDNFMIGRIMAVMWGNGKMRR